MSHRPLHRIGNRSMLTFGLFLAFVPYTLGAAVGEDPEAANLQLEVGLTLGSAEVADEYFFGRVSSVVEDSDGNIFVSEVDQQVIMKFSKAGRLEKSLTTVGDGPGDVMPFACIGIDARNRLYLAGQGGRVEILDADFKHLDSFQRANPAEFARGIAVLADGSVAMAVKNLANETTIDLYGPDRRHVRSFSDSFGKGKDLPWQVTSMYAGGDLALLAPDLIVYAQMAPFEIRQFDRRGNLVAKTSAGGAEFVPSPPMPEIKGDRTIYRMPPLTTGVAGLPDGRIVVSAARPEQDGSEQTRLYLYDRRLALIGTRESTGLESVVGSAPNGEVFFFRRGDEQNVVYRARVRRATD